MLIENMQILHDDILQKNYNTPNLELFLSTSKGSKEVAILNNFSGVILKQKTCLQPKRLVILFRYSVYDKTKYRTDYLFRYYRQFSKHEEVISVIFES